LNLALGGSAACPQCGLAVELDPESAVRPAILGGLAFVLISALWSGTLRGEPLLQALVFNGVWLFVLRSMAAGPLRPRRRPVAVGQFLVLGMLLSAGLVAGYLLAMGAEPETADCSEEDAQAAAPAAVAGNRTPQAMANSDSRPGPCAQESLR